MRSGRWARPFPAFFCLPGCEVRQAVAYTCRINQNMHKARMKRGAKSLSGLRHMRDSGAFGRSPAAQESGCRRSWSLGCGMPGVWVTLLAWVLAALAGTTEAQESGSGHARLNGRIMDLATDEGVAGAMIVLAPLQGSGPAGKRAETESDSRGLFLLEWIEPGAYELTAAHSSYGVSRELLTLRPGDEVTLRVTMSVAAIELEPVVVMGARRARALGRASGGSRRNRVTSEDLAPAKRTGTPLPVALAQLVPGVRTRSGRSQVGELLCVEFRGLASLSGPGCLAPIVVVDHVRQANGLVTLNTIPISDIQSVEALGPGEAGVRYGANANAGAILIETISGRDMVGGAVEVAAGAYSWSLESRPYPWLRAFAAAAGANAAALALGHALSQRCLSYENLGAHLYGADCGFVLNAASRAAVYAAPQVAVGYVTRWAGATDVSRGNPWRSALAAGMVGVPGLVLALTDEESGFSGSRGLGIALLTVGAPAASVLADRLFRDIGR